MNKNEVFELLNVKHEQLYDWLKQHENQNWENGPDGKWTTGQHVLHLIQSEKALNKALSMPRFLLKYKFGLCNRAVRNYDEIIEKYNEKLAKVPKGVESPFSKNMIIPKIAEKQNYISQLKMEAEKMIKKYNKWNEKDLEKYIVPHPLLGRMPLKEIVMWNAYHTETHLKILNEKY